MHKVLSQAQLILVDVAKDDFKLLVFGKALNEWLETLVSAKTRQVVCSPQLLKEILISFISLLEYVVELPILNVYVHCVSLGIFTIHNRARIELKHTSTLFTAFVKSFHVCVSHLSVVSQNSRHHVQKLDTIIRRLQVKRFVHEVDL